MPKPPFLRARRAGPTPARKRAPFRPRVFRPWLELLEDRTLLSAGDSIANAVALSFTNSATLYQAAHVTEYLANPNDVQLNRISLNAGDLVTAAVDTAPYGGGLNSYLRVFEDMGGGKVLPIAANDNVKGVDAGLTFRAPGGEHVLRRCLQLR